MTIRDRIKDFRRVKGRDLLPNPRNWRRHPQAQRDAMRAILEEVGFAGAALARETPAGLMLIDGHLRAEIEPDAELPVLVLDVDEAEAAKLLATYDPLGKMAEPDPDALGKLLAEIDTESEALRVMLEGLAAEAGGSTPDSPSDSGSDSRKLQDRFIVPPFSVLDARQGYWQERKRAWIALGIQSELGRGMCRPHGKDTRPATAEGEYGGGIAGSEVRERERERR